MKTTRRTLRGLVGVLAALAGMQLQAQDTAAVNMPVPALIHQLRSHQVIEQIIAQRHELLLSDAQFADLQALWQAVCDERPIYESTGRSKPPYQRPARITTPEQALAKAFSMLTPQQQHASLMLFARQGREP